MNERTKSNITVMVPDLSAPIAHALGTINQRLLDSGGIPLDGLEVNSAIGYVMTSSGIMVLNRLGLGCGIPITASNRIRVPLYNKGVLLGILELSDTELIMLPTQSEEQLEDFIADVHGGGAGANNYNVWFLHLTKNQPMEANVG